MRVAVLCPGPGLGVFINDGYDIRIAVNRAVLPHMCGCRPEWWSVHDAGTFAKVDPGYFPHVFTTQAAVGHPHLRNNPNGVARFHWSEKLYIEQADVEPPRTTFSWSMYSATSAVALAGHLGASQIDIYGAPMAGEEDDDGELAGETRTDTRWTNERQVLAKLMKWQRSNGIYVRRIHGLP